MQITLAHYVIRPLKGIKAQVAVWRRNARTRRALVRLPKHLLPDVGLTPAAAKHEAAKGFWRA